ncbi:MAG: hypothetical protein LBM97_02030 [Candidatus Nomurabacteria bacterium]|jgi:DNA polymerase III delta subunit|nr:hypothetical protein [Candidatus Nomurabacteria bacterium]
MIYMFYGTDSASKQARIAELFAKSKAEKEILASDEIESPSFLMSFLLNSSLFSDQRFVILQNISQKSELANYVIDNFDNVKKIPNITLIFSESELDRRGVFYKTFGKTAEEFVITENVLNEKLNLPQTFMGETFSLTNNILRGQNAKALQIISKIEQANFGSDDEAFRLFGLISTQLLQFLMIKSADGKTSLTKIALDMNAKSDYALKQLQNAGAKLSRKDAQKLTKLAADLDKKLKTSEIKPWQAVKRLCAGI